MTIQQMFQNLWVMMMKLNKTREMLVNLYLDALKVGIIPWHDGITASNVVRNGVSDRKYHGINRALLDLICYNRGYDDPRFYTFTQIKDHGWKLNNAKGKGIPIEFWSLYDKRIKKTVSMNDYKKIIELDPAREDDFVWLVKNSYVFNAAHIEGLPANEIQEKFIDDEAKKTFVDRAIYTMGVNLKESFDYQCFYRLREDAIYIPDKTGFENEEAYYSGLLHELGHSTMHEKRLNRSEGMYNKFGSKEYAKEELRAEIASSFIHSDLTLNLSDETCRNHQAYIQSWISILQKDENELFRAIRDAEHITSYIEEKGGIELLKEQQKEDPNIDEDTLEF